MKDIPTQIVYSIRADLARAFGLVPYARQGKTWLIAYAHDREPDSEALRNELRPYLRRDYMLVPVRAEDIDAALALHYSEGLIEHCPGESQFALQCPRQWRQLVPTDDPKQRFCGECQQIVHLVSTGEEAQRRAQLNQCVAIAGSRGRLLGKLLPIVRRTRRTLGRSERRER